MFNLVEERTGIRKSTKMKSAEAEKRLKERKEVERKRAMRKRKNSNATHKLTQEELLEEAKETEKLNLKSLGKSYKLNFIPLLLFWPNMSQ